MWARTAVRAAIALSCDATLSAVSDVGPVSTDVRPSGVPMWDILRTGGVGTGSRWWDFAAVPELSGAGKRMKVSNLPSGSGVPNVSLARARANKVNAQINNAPAPPIAGRTAGLSIRSSHSVKNGRGSRPENDATFPKSWLPRTRPFASRPAYLTPRVGRRIGSTESLLNASSSLGSGDALLCAALVSSCRRQLASSVRLYRGEGSEASPDRRRLTKVPSHEPDRHCDAGRRILWQAPEFI